MNRLKEIRMSKGISVSKLAKMADVTRQTIHRLESEQDNTASVKTLKALADAMSVKVSDFFVD